MVRSKRQFYYSTINQDPYSNWSSNWSSNCWPPRRNTHYYNNGRYRHNEGRYHSNAQIQKTKSTPSPVERYNERRKYFNAQNQKTKSRPSSPVEGSEEFMARKIKETSAIIMRQLLTPNEAPQTLVVSASVSSEAHTCQDDKTKTTVHKKKGFKKLTKPLIKRNNDKPDFNVKEIQEKVLNHIANLKSGRRENFINANKTGLDCAIEDIQKQKRLELSRLLRYMCSEPGTIQESEEVLNTVIPDIGIDLQQLPLEFIRGLEATIKFDFDEDYPLQDPNESCTDAGSEKIDIKIEELMTSSAEFTVPFQIKDEPIDDLCKPESSVNDFSLETVVLPNNGITNNTEVASNTIPAMQQLAEAQCQTDVSISGLCSASEITLEKQIKELSTIYIQSVKNKEDMLRKVNYIHNCINQLNELTQLVLKTYCENDCGSSKADSEVTADNQSGSGTRLTNDSGVLDLSVGTSPRDKRFIKKRKIGELPGDCDESDSEMAVVKSEVLPVDHILEFPEMREKVLVIQRVDNQLIIATEAGKVIYIDIKTSKFVYTLEITNVPITSLLFVQGLSDFVYMYVGSHDNVLKIYNFHKKQLVKALLIDDKINCMDSMWDYVFMGCQCGTFIRYSIEKNKIELKESNIGSSVMVIKAAYEGPRKVLLMGYKKAPIYLRCALSGLVLRNFNIHAISPTVYSLVLDNNVVYCGTAENNIFVFSFHDGTELNKIFGRGYVGISCMKIYNNYLFAGCYSGCIGLYNLKTRRHERVLNGPGGGIISMEVLNNQVIVGTLDKKFGTIPLPSYIIAVNV